MISSAMTLVELMLVVAIAGTLAAIGIPAYNSYIDKAKNEQAIEDIRFIEAAIKMFQTDNGTLPETLGEVRSANLFDPWEHPYQYLKIEGKKTSEVRGKWRHFHRDVPVNFDFDLYSMGKNGRSKPPLTAQPSRDDIVRMKEGAYVGPIAEY